MPQPSKESNVFKLKSYWRDIQRKDFKYFCASCHKERRIHTPPKVGTLQHIFQVSITTAFFTLITWPLWEWKGVVSFIPIWIVFEAIFRMKIRSALVCTDCGFDPVLYLVDSKKAAKAVEEHWRKKFEENGWAYPEQKVRSIKSGKWSVPQVIESKNKSDVKANDSSVIEENSPSDTSA